MLLNKFQPQHQKGILLLSGMIIGVVAFLIAVIIGYHLAKKDNVSLLEKEDDISSQNKYSTKYYEENTSRKRYNHSSYKNNNYYSFKSFNPNTISKDELIRFGLSEKQANNIIHYRQAGGTFRRVEDLKKLYCMSDYLYSRMSPYVVINQKQLSLNKQSIQNNHQTLINNYTSTTHIIDLNSADTIDLQTISGVGPKYSSRIYKYGKKLGGYVSVEQLREVWGMTEELYNKIKKQVTIKPFVTRKVNINSMNIKVLTSHPYIDYYLAKEIIMFHKSEGDYKQIDDIKRIHILDDNTFNKIKPYLAVK